MKKYIKAGFGATIGVALAITMIDLVNAIAKCCKGETEEEAKTEENDENE